MKKNAFSLAIVLFLAAVMLAGCSSQKGAAETAVKAAEEAFNAAKGEAVKYVPDQVKSIEGALAALKDKFAKGDYKAVLADAKSVADQAEHQQACQVVDGSERETSQDGRGDSESGGHPLQGQETSGHSHQRGP